MKNTVVVKVVDVTVALLLVIESFVVISVSMGYGLAGGGVELLVFIPLKKRKSNISSHAENNRSLLYTL